MERFITDLHIQNFKSIKDVRLDCKRINLFIGKPNVGKSNILEALSLFQGPSTNTSRFLEDYIRYEDQFKEVFYDNDWNNWLQVKTNLSEVHVFYEKIDKYFIVGYGDSFQKVKETWESSSARSFYDNWGQIYDKCVEEIRQIDKNRLNQLGYMLIRPKGDLNISNLTRKYWSNVKKYQFKKSIQFLHEYKYEESLLSPFGDNLIEIIDTPKLREEVAQMFAEYGLDFVLTNGELEMEIQKRQGSTVYKYPYSSMADTLQRMIFHIAAIESNKDSILLFEEPESHAFPPYIWELANRIVMDESNQYFIATHSPYLLNTILEEGDRDEVGLFITYYEDYQTKIKKLSDEEISQLLNHGTDIFLNLNAFIPHND